MCFEEGKELDGSREKQEKPRVGSDFARAPQEGWRLSRGKAQIAADRSLVRALGQANVGLPRPHRYVLQAHEHEVLEADATRTNAPSRLRRVLHVLVFHFLPERSRQLATNDVLRQSRCKTHLNETLDCLCHIPSQLSPCDRLRRATEVSGRDLPTPGRVARPLFTSSISRCTAASHRGL